MFEVGDKVRFRTSHVGATVLDRFNVEDGTVVGPTLDRPHVYRLRLDGGTGIYSNLVAEDRLERQPLPRYRMTIETERADLVRQAMRIISGTEVVMVVGIR